MSKSTFTTKLFTVNSWVIALLPPDISATLPSRGTVLIKGTMNDTDFLAVLEPDGRGSHWLNVDFDISILYQYLRRAANSCRRQFAHSSFGSPSKIDQRVSVNQRLTGTVYFLPAKDIATKPIPTPMTDPTPTKSQFSVITPMAIPTPVLINVHPTNTIPCLSSVFLFAMMRSFMKLL